MAWKVGTNLSETLYGTSFADNMSGLSGHDLIYGYGGDDEISGDGGNDTIWGGASITSSRSSAYACPSSAPHIAARQTLHFGF